MEDKKLDFSQPLLSVRRFPIPSTAAFSEVNDKNKTNIPPPCIPHYKSDLKSGPVRNPGTIPFTWEQIPGRPKDGSKSRTLAPQLPHPTAPKLPPGRILKSNQRFFPVGSVGQIIARENQSSLNESLNDNEDSKEEIDKKSPHSEDSDETYVDALSTLSHTESFFLNCSVSGVSGLDGLDLKPPGTSMDPLARDLMISRFLPAAKAMTSETPQYASRKHPVAHERQRQRFVAGGGDEGPSLFHENHDIIQHYDQDQGGEDSENEESTDDESENSAAKACGCGLFPRFGLRNSLSLLNSVAGTRLQPPVSSVRSLRTRSAYASSSTSTSSTSKNSACQNSSARSLSYEDKQVLGVSLETKNGSRSCNSLATHEKSPVTFREILADHTEDSDSDSTSPLVEKTLYVDSVQKQESLNLDTKLSNSEGLSDVIGNDFKAEHIKCLNIWNEKEMLQPGPGIFSSEKLKDELLMDMKKDFGKEDQRQLIQESFDSAGPTANANRNEDLKNQESPSIDGFKKCEGNFSQFPLALLPLPHSPSDSWLCRTLPSISLRKNQSQRSYCRNVKTNARSQDSKTASIDPTWEAIVKTSNVHHGYKDQALAAATI